ncbi:MAG: tRNA uridine-5-carboxymethylaminomethyl(34) synthesis GTPase MnmE [Rhizobiales bacterium 24-66-13]|jgi:tRNA modification GTPase|nr:MAG: tRNA uridine-5-carboxymethylaminomethyl(34) synthesis GTPase MnmE [Rhizobiales bacterium 35-66-30]OYZ71175.1 MAG: tRNA uridine-5-carboxymethylaminomethyl(34) synthesis GTPase MnmE [Rhizobiales bacterium 24-66-13]OZB04970.1 MAG: tRNA uridine-5-carboxymethylaminomethyl(34) synthesis GTPase MnmE [Rhizobiales bacterium 39-66-18]HQS10888.1 tRNA uridine-5-carboxymethylaminomethyl(34) synthesis GTPase MnmE [Xanthobacteraceae bacterium]
MRSSDTIFALSSGRLPSGVALVRISGPSARAAAQALAGTVPAPRHATYTILRAPPTGEALDRGLILFFEGPRSATGEDLLELHLHGGRAVVAAVLSTLSGLDGFRPAQPGEFTRRAHANGKMDLAEVEGLGDLIAAESEAQRRQALAQASGVLSRRVSGWRARLIRALALVEATIDFSDEDDVPEDLTGPALLETGLLREELAAALADSARGEMVRDGLSIAIAGPPNAGKSTLLNRLAGREAAIVSHRPGTTRDLLEVHLELAGQAVTLIDTAGLRETDDEVEAEGIRRARARAASADLVLWLSEEGAPPPPELAQALAVRTKADQAETGPGEDERLAISAATGQGIDELIALIEARAAELGGGEPALITRERQRLALKDALAHLDRALARADGGGEGLLAEDLLAEDLRLAARALDALVGRVDMEDVLDALFRTFCIGK